VASLSSRELRRTVERSTVAANVTAGWLVSTYYTLTAELPQGTSPVLFWITSIVSSGVLAGTFAFIGLRFSRRRFQPMLDWIDEGRPPTDEERRYVMQAPVAVAILVMTFWALTGVPIAITDWLMDGTPAEAAKAYTGSILGGLFAAGLSYFLTERGLRPLFALVLEGQAAPARAFIGVRSRLLLTWLLGSGVPLLAIVLTPLARETRAEYPLMVPIVFLAVIGAAGGIAITSAASRSIAEPLDQLRNGMDRVRQGRPRRGGASRQRRRAGRAGGGLQRHGARAAGSAAAAGPLRPPRRRRGRPPCHRAGHRPRRGST
jgi:adenylate cyclase